MWKFDQKNNILLFSITNSLDYISWRHQCKNAFFEEVRWYYFLTYEHLFFCCCFSAYQKNLMSSNMNHSLGASAKIWNKHTCKDDHTLAFILIYCLTCGWRLGPKTTNSGIKIIEYEYCFDFQNNINIFQTQCLRIILNIKRNDHVTNKHVYTVANTQPPISSSALRQTRSYSAILSHVE